MRRNGLVILLMVCLLAVVANSCVHQPYVLPADQRKGDPNICFEWDVLPVFIANCAKGGCHDAGSQEEGYILDSYSNIVRKGIVPGNPAASKIWQSVSMHIFDVTFMPLGSPALTATQLDLIKRWIATGAIDSGACATQTCDTGTFTYSAAIAPMMQLYCIGCHNSASAPGGSLMDYSSVSNAALNGRLLGDIAHQPGYNAMPPTAIQLTACQLTQVRKWVAAGAQNN